MYHKNEHLLCTKSPKFAPNQYILTKHYKKHPRWKFSSSTNKIQDIWNYKHAILWKNPLSGTYLILLLFEKNHPTQYNIILDSGFPWGHLDFLQCFHIIITSIHSIFEKLILWGIQNGLICLFTPITFQDMIVSLFTRLDIFENRDIGEKTHTSVHLKGQKRL